MKTINSKERILYEILLSTLSSDDFNLSNKYLNEGVSFDKFFITPGPAVCHINGKMVSLQVRSVLTSRDIARINNSNGIVITNHKDHFRYGFIPK